MTPPPNEPESDSPNVVARAFFYSAVGVAVSEWGYVERVAAMLFGIMVGGDEWQVLGAEAAFASVMSFSAKLGMLRAAGRIVLTEPEFVDLTRLVDEITDLAEVRNSLAHGTVTVDKAPRSDGDQMHVERLATAAHDPAFDKPGRRGAAKSIAAQSYNGSQIIDYGKRFRQAALSIVAFADRLAPGLLPPSAPP